MQYYLDNYLKFIYFKLYKIYHKMDGFDSEKDAQNSTNALGHLNMVEVTH
jgi:hypothetical protein